MYRGRCLIPAYNLNFISPLPHSMASADHHRSVMIACLPPCFIFLFMIVNLPATVHALLSTNSVISSLAGQHSAPPIFLLSRESDQRHIKLTYGSPAEIARNVDPQFISEYDDDQNHDTRENHDHNLEPIYACWSTMRSRKMLMTPTGHHEKHPHHSFLMCRPITGLRDDVMALQERNYIVNYGSPQLFITHQHDNRDYQLIKRFYLSHPHFFLHAAIICFAVGVVAAASSFFLPD